MSSKSVEAKDAAPVGEVSDGVAALLGLIDGFPAEMAIGNVDMKPRVKEGSVSREVFERLGEALAHHAVRAVVLVAAKEELRQALLEKGLAIKLMPYHELENWNGDIDNAIIGIVDGNTFDKLVDRFSENLVPIVGDGEAARKMAFFGIFSAILSRSDITSRKANRELFERHGRKVDELEAKSVFMTSDEMDEVLRVMLAQDRLGDDRVIVLIANLVDGRVLTKSDLDAMKEVTGMIYVGQSVREQISIVRGTYEVEEKYGLLNPHEVFALVNRFTGPDKISILKAVELKLNRVIESGAGDEVLGVS